MTRIVHIANTNVEYEFASPVEESLEESLSRHPFFLQLQFLPLLYADPVDIVAVTAMPNPEYLALLNEQTKWWPDGLPSLALLRERSSFQGAACVSWGASRQVRAWAEARAVKYHAPDPSIAQLINSKAFSFRYTSLPGAKLLAAEQELCDWLREIPGAKVLKTCFGLSGQGNWRIEGNSPTEPLLAFCRKEWDQKRPVLAEPWLDRIYDFSTQWFIHPDRKIELFGATRFKADAKGNYQGTLAGPSGILFSSSQSFLEEHYKYAQKALVEMAYLGFFGSVGIDAFVYRCLQSQRICLNPLVEINGRQTMSLVALRLQERICPKQVLCLSFQRSAHSGVSLLPRHLPSLNIKGGKFRRQLIAEILGSSLPKRF